MRNPLSQERWATVENIFVAAADLPPGERRQFVESRCGADRELREEVLSLLRYDTRPPNFEEPLGRLAHSALIGEPLEGTALGPWLVERELGRGGMSEVYLATRADGRFSKTVAIKVIRRGMDTKAVIDRFHAERRILAALDHPYIARLSGRRIYPSGLPYIVMEYVEGLPIDRWCQDSPRDCRTAMRTRRESLRRGRIRPSQPGHSSRPEARETSWSMATETPGCSTSASRASSTELPNQARCVRSRPNTPARNKSPARRSAPRPMFTRSEWSWRIADRRKSRSRRHSPTACREEPERRYLSVDALALDLRAYLAGRPVAAHPDSLRYRATKFVRRNRLGVTAAAAVLLALTGGIIVSTWEAERANSEAATAKAVTDFLRDDLLGQASPNAGPDLRVRTVLDRAAGNIAGKFKDKPLVEAGIRNTMGESYYALGLYPQAHRSTNSPGSCAARNWEREASRHPGHALTSVAVIDRRQGRFDEAERLYNRILAVERARVARRIPQLFR